MFESLHFGATIEANKTLLNKVSNSIWFGLYVLPARPVKMGQRVWAMGSPPVTAIPATRDLETDLRGDRVIYVYRGMGLTIPLLLETLTDYRLHNNKSDFRSIR